ncbi:hypothetical protein J2X97_000347 [Epilithonimonas hungarica]|uniref:hypothetical protein n=1 Tax=Epilithonimonas hungarica TaxID=454006 RepID=UPI002785AC6A|nr:hypothetical protein [Epilithonimonas hungarica]MDP9954710.1 hypothetical protein [Epilithonimonas hungarica]
MKVKENITVYQCEYCQKKLFLKHAMIKHEDLCFKNPKNNKPCYSCIFCHKEEIRVDFDDPYNPDGYTTKKVEASKCVKLDIIMFPWSIERKRLHEKYETYSEQEPMPRECEHHKYEGSESDFELLFKDLTNYGNP